MSGTVFIQMCGGISIDWACVCLFAWERGIMTPVCLHPWLQKGKEIVSEFKHWMKWKTAAAKRNVKFGLIPKWKRGPACGCWIGFLMNFESLRISHRRQPHRGLKRHRWHIFSWSALTSNGALPPVFPPSARSRSSFLPLNTDRSPMKQSALLGGLETAHARVALRRGRSLMDANDFPFSRRVTPVWHCSSITGCSGVRHWGPAAMYVDANFSQWEVRAPPGGRYIPHDKDSGLSSEFQKKHSPKS